MAACTSRGPQAPAVETLEHVLEAALLLVVGGALRLVGEGEVGHESLEAEMPLAADRLDQPQRTAAGAQPTRRIPVSTFRCTSRTRPRRAATSPSAAIDLRRVHDGAQLAVDNGPQLVGRRLAQQQHRRVQTVDPQGLRLAGVGHGQPVGPGPEGGRATGTAPCP